MFLDVGTALRMALLLSSQLLCRQPSNYKTRFSLATMNAGNRLHSYLHVPQRYIAVSFIFCKPIWIKAKSVNVLQMN